MKNFSLLAGFAVIMLCSCLCGCSDSEKADCMMCAGSGIYYAPGTVPCRNCFPITVNYITVGVTSLCDQCAGSGGTVAYYGGYQYLEQCPLCMGFGGVLCSACLGTQCVAETVAYPCPACMGSGEIVINNAPSYEDQMRMRNVNEAVFNILTGEDTVSDLDEVVLRERFEPVMPQPFESPFKPYRSHDEVLEDDREEFSKRLERTRDVYESTGVWIDPL